MKNDFVPDFIKNRPDIKAPDYLPEPLKQVFDAGVDAALPYVTRLESQLSRLQKIEAAAMIVVRQTNAKSANVKKKQNYRVWIEQVNQTYVDVKATSSDEAREKGYRKWRREDAHSRISDVANLGDDDA